MSLLFVINILFLLSYILPIWTFYIDIKSGFCHLYGRYVKINFDYVRIKHAVSDLGVH